MNASSAIVAISVPIYQILHLARNLFHPVLWVIEFPALLCQSVHYSVSLSLSSAMLTACKHALASAVVGSVIFTPGFPETCRVKKQSRKIWLTVSSSLLHTGHNVLFTSLRILRLYRTDTYSLATLHKWTLVLLGTLMT
ncbi:hypothetical protein ES288_A05G336300v1 [Gossypium darwinii]|uniref:Uncharacterized protein n=1 Tax=Gossypium darwinii TaxID=34276 RepID=A0A5D2GPM7_GOSDA|nr:hypothetical protein ES288_A05G336300v1 [Gossypium darwinii]